LKFITIELKKTTKNVLNQIKFYARNNEQDEWGCLKKGENQSILGRKCIFK
jgi:hypothetical protein